MSKFQSYILSISLLIWIVTGSFWQMTKLPIYYFGVSQLILVSAFIIYQLSSGNLQKFICSIFLFLALNGLLDELFFDPTEFNINEYLTFLLIIIWNVLKYSRVWRNFLKL